MVLPLALMVITYVPSPEYVTPEEMSSPGCTWYTSSEVRQEPSVQSKQALKILHSLPW